MDEFKRLKSWIFVILTVTGFLLSLFVILIFLLALLPIVILLVVFLALYSYVWKRKNKKPKKLIDIKFKVKR